MMTRDTNTIVVGAGIGGLSTALLLADAGVNVLVLESHTTVGGCAGAFDRFERVGEGAGRTFRRFRFDAGATTLSGLHPGGPFDQLFRQIGNPPPIRRVDPGIISHLPDGRLLRRYSDHDRWVAETSRLFGPEGQAGFWGEIASISERCWELATTNLRFPPETAFDVLSLIRPANLRGLPLLRLMRQSVTDLLVRYNLQNNVPFNRFIDEQLMITAQNLAADTPLPVGAMGLSYPADTWYPDGGMAALAEWMVARIEERSGEVRTKHRVTSIGRQGGGWRLDTSRGSFTADHVVANLTLWDLERLVEERSPRLEREIDSLPPTWGALDWTAAVPDVVDDAGSLYHQIAVDPLPFADSSSIFLSLSPPDDRLRAPEGYRTLSVSTHVGDPAGWIRVKREDPEEYERRKNEYAGQVVETLEREINGFAGAGLRYQTVATPASFHTFTGRHNGSVGGIPFSLDRGLINLPGFRTGQSNLSIVGDTLYPGQGAPGVLLGALRVVHDRLKSGR